MESVGKWISQLTVPDRNFLGNERASARLVVNFGRNRHVQGMYWENTLTAKPLGLVGWWSHSTYLIWSATSTSWLQGINHSWEVESYVAPGIPP